MNTNQPAKKDFLWNSYFVTCGVLCLVLWNSTLNLTDYFNVTLSSNISVYLTFSLALGQAFSFIVSPSLFSHLKYKTAIIVALISAITSFVLIFVIIEWTSFLKFKIISTMTLIFVVGFFGSFFQSKSMGLAASISSEEIVYFNFGTGIAGFCLNLLAYIFNMLYPYDFDSDNKLHQLRCQLKLYLVVVICIFFFYFVLESFFELRFKDFLDTKIEHEIEEPFASEFNRPGDPEAINGLKVMRRSLDLLLGILFQYVVTLTVISYFLATSYYKYDIDDNSWFTIPAYLFFFNLMDAIGKFMPPHTLITSFKKIHIWNFARFALIIYFILILEFNISIFLTSGLFRCIVFALTGFWNGYFTNSFMSSAAGRFKSPAEKGLTGYFSVLFLLIGISMGSFMGVMFTVDIVN